MKLKSENILRAIKAFHAESIGGRQLMSALNLPAGARRILQRQLRELERQGLIRRMRGGRYALSDSSEVLEGVITFNRRGAGLIRNAEGESVRIPDRYLGGALDGDLVHYVLIRRDRMNRPNGKVVKVVERSARPVVGVYQHSRDGGFIVPVDSANGQPIAVTECELNVQSGDWVVVRLVAGKNKSCITGCEIIERLGAATDPAVQIKAVACRFSIPLHFPDAVIKESEKISEKISSAELSGRVDLRSLPFITIDGETARDFDDAVTVTAENNAIRLYVAIADVSHFVTAGSSLDQSAYARGTSVYFPGFCIPMLPEKLSNGVCSLKPDVDRLVVVAELLIDQAGLTTQTEFYPAVICSSARMTYHEVQATLERSEISEENSAAHLYQLKQLRELAARLSRMRRQRGALDMDIPEPEIMIDSSGSVETVKTAERLEAHRIIEECMLAANEAVAEFISEHNIDLVYRIHEPPDQEDLGRLNKYLDGLSVPKLNSGPGLQAGMRQLVESAAELTDRRLISRMMLQSMKRARYSVENPGHFGLAAKKYCHFTSPIRRYPDLLVHRILKEILAGQNANMGKNDLIQRAEQASKSERLAVDAERDVTALYLCQFLEPRTGEEFSGVISSVQKFGFFVELDPFPIEGLVHIASLEDDYYHFDPDRECLIGERTGNLFRAGMSIKISVENVNIARREIDFRLTRSSPPSRSRKQGRSKKRRR